MFHGSCRLYSRRTILVVTENPYQMKEYAEMRLAQYAKPTISYVLNAMDLSVLTGYEHEAPPFG